MTIQTQPPITRPEIGDIVPPLALKRRTGAVFDPFADDEAGRFQVLVFAGSFERPAAAATIGAFAAARDGLDEHKVHVHLVLPAGEADKAAGAPFPVLVDGSGAALRAMGIAAGAAGDGAAVLVIAPNGHVLARIDPDNADDPVEAILALVRPLNAARKAVTAPPIHPPVLVVPDVLSPEDCRRLISIYAMQGQEFVDPGHNQLKGRTTDCKMRIPEYGRNDRIDHWVCSAANNSVIDARLVPRLMPEIHKAFQYKVTRHERYRIACYEGYRGGSQHGHRDNTLPFVAHRRFAVTINLNADEYEGAELRFPEFSEAAYKTPTGSAIVFSCSLLHEVMAMRSGRRFALLAFLFGDT
ncbi:2OG-Fe(II) oxygenase [Thalassobaculum sp.]|uniref:2OG-Fe(II) oxygenase n=1 Tax=Thalassobaculum sp. TaxID=2022740 RepID=UPI0032EC2D91